MVIKEDILYFNYIWLELTIVSFVKYLFSCNGESVQFVMNIPDVLWFTTSKFLMLGRNNKILMRHVSRKDLSFNVSIN